MPSTALTGSTGWTGIHPFQLGGPPLTNTYARPLPSTARPLLAHVYDNDGVSFKATFPVLSWSPIKATPANGGYDQITLSMARTSTISIYGQATYGTSLYGGVLVQGNIVRLSEVGSPWPGFIFGGIVEDIPDTIAPTQVTHNLLLTHFAFELDDVQSTSVYTLPTDLSQIVRDAVAQTFHCSCDQVSVPPTTGILAPQAAGTVLDFRNQTIKQQIDTCRAMAGPTWYWYVDELGRVWFQAMGGSAVYTVTRGPNYDQRTTSNSIQNRKNQITVVGGVPTGGSANAQATYNGISQRLIGVRALFPVISMPNITDQDSLQLIANNVGLAMDRIWRQINVPVRTPFSQRIHGSQPGGAMFRYWEPTLNAIPESEVGAGMYVGPLIVNSVTWDGTYQTVVAGDIPLISQTDVQNMVNGLTGRFAANTLQVTGAALNLSQTFTGSFQSGTAITSSTGLPGTFWELDQQEFKAVDPNGVTRAEMGNLGLNGISPQQWGFRANGPDGTPIFDSLGLIAVMSQLGQVHFDGPSPQAITSFSDTLLDDGNGHPATVTFTLVRQARVLLLAIVAAYVSTTSAGLGIGQVSVNVDGVDQETLGLAGTLGFQLDPSATQGVPYNGPQIWSEPLSQGSHTIELVGTVGPNPQATLNIIDYGMWVFLLGS